MDDGIGTITKPDFMPDAIKDGKLTGVVAFMNAILVLIFVVAGLYAFLNFIIAGFGFMTAGGDAKVITKSWDRIWQSLLGLLIIVGSFLLAAIVGILIYKNPAAILQPTLQQ